jgi:hypothetical protein
MIRERDALSSVTHERRRSASPPSGRKTAARAPSRSGDSHAGHPGPRLTLAGAGRIAASMDAAALEAAGLYDPGAPNAADRLALLEWLAARGFTIDEMAEAARAGLLTALAADRVLRPGPRLTLEEIAAELGVAPDRIETLRVAAGLRPIDPRARVFSADDVESIRGVEVGAALFGERATRRFTRTV